MFFHALCFLVASFSFADDTEAVNFNATVNVHLNKVSNLQAAPDGEVCFIFVYLFSLFLITRLLPSLPVNGLKIIHIEPFFIAKLSLTQLMELILLPLQMTATAFLNLLGILHQHSLHSQTLAIPPFFMVLISPQRLLPSLAITVLKFPILNGVRTAKSSHSQLPYMLE